MTFRNLLSVFFILLTFCPGCSQATSCNENEYVPTLTWNDNPAEVTLVPATGNIPFAEGTWHVYQVCHGGYGVGAYLTYDGETNLSSEGIFYKIYDNNGNEIPINNETRIANAAQHEPEEVNTYILNTTLKIKFFRQESSRRLDWSGQKHITSFGANTIHFKDTNVNSYDSYLSNAIPLTPAMQVKAQRCQLVNVSSNIYLGTVDVGDEGEFVPFSIDLFNCPARTNPDYWGVRIFIDDPNSTESETNLLRPATDSVTGYGVAIDVSNGGIYTPMRFNTGDTPSLIKLSDFDYTSGTTSINFRAMLKLNGDEIKAGEFRATGNIHVVFE